MTPQQIDRVRDIYHAAIDLASGEQADFVREASHGDDAVRSEVESLLRVRGRASSFLEAATIESPNASPLIGRTIGGYEVLREIAAGGMGTVYEARQREPLRLVALKVVRSALLGRTALSRFRHEAQILGGLSHPAIAKVYDAGTHNDGSGLIAYFTMELIDGATDICDFVCVRRWSVPDRLSLFVKVCDAVAYAHQRGVIHRDLKPSNILVDDAGNPKVLDFGLAKLVGSEIAVASIQTQAGQVLGTIGYMSPEQISGENGDIDTRCDVYALGVILYQMLTRRMPYDTAGATLPEQLRAIREEEPARPASLDRSLRGDLETIIFKAMEKDRARRYPSVAALADDITRYLRHEPISARPPSALYNLAKFSRRNRGLVAGIAAAVVLLIAGVIGTSIGMSRAMDARRLADLSAAHSRINEYRASIQAAAAGMRADDVLTAVQQLNAAPAELRGWEWRYLWAQSDQSVATFPSPGIPSRQANIAIHPDGSRCIVARHGFLTLADARTGEVILKRPEARIGSLHFSPDGTRVIFCTSHAGRVVILDASTLAEVGDGLSFDREVCGAAWRPDGRAFAVAAGRWASTAVLDHQLRLFDAATLSEVGVLTGQGGRFEAPIEFHPDGRCLFAIQAPERLVVWNLNDQTHAHWPMASGQTIRTFCTSRDGRLLATSGSAGVQLWDVDSRELVLNLGPAVAALAFSPDARTLYGAAATLTAWDVGTGLAQHRRGHHTTIYSIAVSPASPDGAPVLSATWDTAEVKAWTFDAPGDFRRFDGYAHATLSPDGRLVAHIDPTRAPGVPYAQNENLLVLRDSHTGRVVRTLDSGFSAGGGDFLFSPDGRYLARVQPGKDKPAGVALWEVASGTRTGAFPIPGSSQHGLAFRAATDGPTRELAVLLQTGVSIRSLPGLEEERTVPVTGVARGVSFSPDGALLAVATSANEVCLFDASSGERIRSWTTDGRPFASLSFSPDGRFLGTTIGEGGPVHAVIWEIATGDIVGRIEGPVRGLLFDSSGTSEKKTPRPAWRCFASMQDGTVRVYGLFPLPGTDSDPQVVFTELLQLRYKPGDGWATPPSQGAGPSGDAGARVCVGREWPAAEYYVWDTTPAAVSTRHPPRP